MDLSCIASQNLKKIKLKSVRPLSFSPPHTMILIVGICTVTELFFTHLGFY